MYERAHEANPNAVMPAFYLAGGMRGMGSFHARSGNADLAVEWCRKAIMVLKRLEVQSPSPFIQLTVARHLANSEFEARDFVAASVWAERAFAGSGERSVAALKFLAEVYAERQDERHLRWTLVRLMNLLEGTPCRLRDRVDRAMMAFQ